MILFIRTQVNIDSVYLLLAPKIMPLLHSVEQWFHCAIYLVQFVIITKG